MTKLHVVAQVRLGGVGAGVGGRGDREGKQEKRIK